MQALSANRVVPLWSEFMSNVNPYVSVFVLVFWVPFSHHDLVRTAIIVFTSWTFCHRWHFLLYLVYKLKGVKDTLNFISSGLKIVKRLGRRHYDPLIIERTIGLVLCPSTALYRPFLKHCTLTNYKLETIWRALSRPRPSDATRSWSSSPLIVNRDSFGHQTWASFNIGGSQHALFGSLYIFLIYNIYYLCCLYIDFYDLSAWCGCWFVVYIRRFIYKCSNVCPVG